jgi:hypothetical protein
MTAGFRFASLTTLVAAICCGTADAQQSAPAFQKPDVAVAFTESRQDVTTAAGLPITVTRLHSAIIPSAGRALWVDNDTVLFLGNPPRQDQNLNYIALSRARENYGLTSASMHLYVWRQGHSLTQKIKAFSLHCHNPSTNVTFVNSYGIHEGRSDVWTLRGANLIFDVDADRDNSLDYFTCDRYQRDAARKLGVRSSYYFHMGFIGVFLEFPRKSGQTHYGGNLWATPIASNIRMIDLKTGYASELEIPDIGIQAHITTIAGANYSYANKEYLLWDAREFGRVLMNPQGVQEASESS